MSADAGAVLTRQKHVVGTNGDEPGVTETGFRWTGASYAGDTGDSVAIPLLRNPCCRTALPNGRLWVEVISSTTEQESSERLQWELTSFAKAQGATQEAH